MIDVPPEYGSPIGRTHKLHVNLLPESIDRREEE